MLRDWISKKQALNLSSSEVAFAVGTVYLLGEVFGALFFGRLSDRFRPKKPFHDHLGGIPLRWRAFRSDLWTFPWLGLLGVGVPVHRRDGHRWGVRAINSAMDGLIPARYRGRVDIGVNGTYWGGALIATVLTSLVVDHLPVSYSWRVAFLFGPALGFVIVFVRKNLPESPRWLLMHGREEEAERAVAQIEQQTKDSGGTLGDVDECQGNRDKRRPVTLGSSRWPEPSSCTTRGGPFLAPAS